MKVREVSYSETVSYRQYCNERFGVVAVVEEDESPEAALDRARAMVKSALQRSERERSFAEKVADVERRILYFERGGHDYDERAAYKQMRVDLLQIGPQGDFESIMLSDYLELDDDDSDDDDSDDDKAPL